MNYLKLGPVRVRVSTKYLAPWAFSLVVVGGLSLWSRDSGGRRIVASYHPRRSPTWYWSVSVSRSCGDRQRIRFSWDPRRFGQWHDYLHLPFGVVVTIARQNYHRMRPQQAYEGDDA